MRSKEFNVVTGLLSVICFLTVLGGCRKDTPPESKQTSSVPAGYGEAASESAQKEAAESQNPSDRPAPDSSVQPPPGANPQARPAKGDAKGSKSNRPKEDDDKKAPTKKKGTAGKIAEKQPKAPDSTSTGPLLPRDPKIAYIEFAEPINWPVSTAASGGEKLLYAFKLTDPKDKKKKATLTVSFVPERKGKTTTVLKNWCEDFLLKGGGHPSVGELAKDEEVNGLKLTTIEVQGAVKQAKGGSIATGQKLIAAVVQHPKGPFFIRAFGPAELIEPHRDAILKFIHSVRKATPAPSSGGEPASKSPADKEAGAANPALKPPADERPEETPQPPEKPESADPPKP